MSATFEETLPADYYERIEAVEEGHWWHHGMREITGVLLGERLDAPGLRVLDAGCGTGGFLAWLLGRSRPDVMAGTDISPEAIERAGRRVPGAELHVAPVREQPFADASFDLVALNDVLQHIPGGDVDESLAELRRVLRPGGALLVRTNGARHARRERDDWRAYDRTTLAATLERAGFDIARLSHVNALPSLAAAARGRTPRAPTTEQHGVPPAAGRLNRVGVALLGAEAAVLRRVGSLPYGHTMIAVGSAPVAVS